MNIEILNELRKKLICGEVRKVAKEAKISTTTVCNWLRGKSYPRQEAKIIEAIKTVTSKRNEQLEKNEQELKTLLTQL